MKLTLSTDTGKPLLWCPGCHDSLTSVGAVRVIFREGPTEKLGSVLTHIESDGTVTDKLAVIERKKYHFVYCAHCERSLLEFRRVR